MTTLMQFLDYKLLQMARKHFEAGGERMRFTFPALITASIKLCRRYKNREHVVSTVIVYPRSLLIFRLRRTTGNLKWKTS